MDILTIKAGVIVQQVNTLGLMGAGLAKQIAEKWPIVYHRYKEEYRGYPLGGVQFIDVETNITVANLFGQSTIGRTGVHTNYAALYEGFQYISYMVPPCDPQIYIPHGIGCGLGGGYWDVVEAIIARTLPDAMIVSLFSPKPRRVVE